MKKNLITGLIALLSVLLLATTAFCEAWRFESNLDCLADRPASTAPVVFTQHDTTVTIGEHYSGVIVVQDGIIIPGEPICLSDEEAGILIKLSKPESAYEVRVIQMADAPPVEVYYTLAYSRYGYSYQYEMPSPGGDGVYAYSYNPQRIVAIRIVNGALDELVLEDHGNGYDGGVPELQRGEEHYQVLAAHAAQVERDKMLTLQKSNCE